MFSLDATHLKEFRNRNIYAVHSIHHWVLREFLLCTTSLAFWQTSETEVLWKLQSVLLTASKGGAVSSYVPDCAFLPTVYINIYIRFSHAIHIFLTSVYFQKLGIKYCSHILFNRKKKIIHLIKLCKIIKKVILWHYCLIVHLIISLHGSLKGFTKLVQD